jgi:hypothetical protein
MNGVSVQRWNRRGLVTAGMAVTAALVGSPVVLAAAGTTASPGPARAAAQAGRAGVHEAVVEPACPVIVTAGHVTCFAMRRVVVANGTAGARRYVVPQAATAGPAGGYTPADLASAYRFNPSINRHQLVAVVDAYNDPTARADLEHFDAQYGLKEFRNSFRQVNQFGSSKPKNLPRHARAGWSVEESLDVQAVRAVCHTCRILLVEAKNTGSNELTRGVLTAVRRGATEISNSYGGPEKKQISTANRKLSRYANRKGIVITASTGDFGWYSWNGFNNGSTQNAPEQPATLPGVVAVGGTSLVINSAGARSSETVWNSNGPNDATGLAQRYVAAASGGGCSRVHDAPRWQQKTAGYTATGCGKRRVDADVSAIANPMAGFDIYDSYTKDASSPRGWATVGGTSLASPVVAAMWALAGGARGTHPALQLYGHLKQRTGSFYDVRSGGNGFCDGTTAVSCAKAMTSLGVRASQRHFLDCVFTSRGKPRGHHSQCEARTGFDGASGVGAPIGLSGFAALHPAVRLRHSRAHAHRHTRFAMHATDPFPGGHIVKRVWRWGDGTHRSTGVKLRHVFRHRGTFTVRLTVTDNYGRAHTLKQQVLVRRH